MSDIREELRAYLARTGSSLSAVAKAVDRSPSAISLWIKDDYTGDAAAVERAVASFLARQQEKAEAPSVEGPFAMTAQAAAALSVLRYAHVHSTMGVIAGPSGNGKTRTIRQYASQNAGVIILTIHHASRSLSEVIHQLSELVGDTGKGRGTLGGITKRLVAKLAGSGRLLIIDEAQFLEHQTVEVLRAVHDGAGIGLVFAGMPRLYRDLVSNTVELWEQIRTRVGMHKRLPPFAIDDARLLLRTLDPQVSDDVCRAAWDASGHCGRSLVHLYHHAARAAASARRRVTVDDVRAALVFLYEAPAAPPARPAPTPAPRPAPRPAPSAPLRPAAAKAVG